MDPSVDLIANVANLGELCVNVQLNILPNFNKNEPFTTVIEPRIISPGFCEEEEAALVGVVVVVVDAAGTDACT